MQAAVMKGPISIAIAASSTYFQSYQSGILTDATACTTDLDHAVNIVGYNTQSSTPYWIVRNSWGIDWGEAGYVNIAMTDGLGVCGINMEASYPNKLDEPSLLVFWFTLCSMLIATFIVVPAAWVGLNKATKICEHPGHVALRSVLYFETFAFAICLLFYMLSAFSDFTNLGFKQMIVFAYYCALHCTFLQLHSALAVRNNK